MGMFAVVASLNPSHYGTIRYLQIGLAYRIAVNSLGDREPIRSPP